MVNSAHANSDSSSGFSPPANGADGELFTLADAPSLSPTPTTPTNGANSGLPSLPGYEVLGLLGQGGMSVVYQARHLQLNRHVALKMLLPGAVGQLARLTTEAEAVARLQHPNIVQIYEVGELAGQPYLCLEFVDGGSLSKWLDGTPRPPEQAAQLVRTLAQAIEAAHKQKIVHRDLKPANILLASVAHSRAAHLLSEATLVQADAEVWSFDRNLWMPKIADFGLAKNIGGEAGQTQTGAILGTPSYMAPEQAEGKGDEIGPAADVYALGAILYELLTGRPPFRGASILETMEQVRSQAPVPPTRLQPKVPAPLEVICLKCLQKDKGKRYTTAAELADDLRRFLAHEPILARPVGEWELLRLWCKRNPALAWSSAVAAGAIGAGIAITLLFGTSQYRAAHRLSQEIARAETALADSESNLRRLETANRSSREFATLSARLAEDRGVALCEQGDVAQGTLWLARALEIAPADATEIQTELRLNLAAWQAGSHQVTTVLPQRGRIRSVVQSPGGDRLVTLGDGTEALLWDVPTRSVVGGPLVHRQPIASASYLADGKVLATRSADGETGIWDAATGRPLFASKPGEHVFLNELGTIAARIQNRQAQFWDLRTDQPMGGPLSTPKGIDRIAFSPDGKSFVTGVGDLSSGREAGTRSAGQLVFFESPLAAGFWDRATEMNVDIPFKLGAVQTVISPDGKALLIVNPRRIQLADTRTGHVTEVPIRVRDEFTRASFSPDGKMILTASRNGAFAEAQMWDIANQRLTGPTLKIQGTLRFAAIHPNNRSILTLASFKWQLWDAANGRLVVESPAKDQSIREIALTQNGLAFLALSSSSMTRVYDASTGQPAGAPLKSARNALQAAISADGQVAAIGDVPTQGRFAEIQLWNPNTGANLGMIPHEGYIRALAISPDGKTLLATDGNRANFVDLATRQITKTIAVPLGTRNLQFNTVPMTMQGVPVSVKGDVQLWSLATGSPVPSSWRSTSPVRTIAFSPGGAKLAVAAADKTTSIWDVRNGKLLRKVTNTQVIDSLRFSPDGNWVLADIANQRVQFFESAAEGGPPHIAEGGNPTFSPNGRYFVSAQGNWATVTHLLGGKVRQQSIHFPDTIQQLVVSPGSKYLGAACGNAALVCDVETERLIRLPHTGKVQALAFSPDDRRVLTGSTNQIARLWDIQSGEPVGREMRHSEAVRNVGFSSDGSQCYTLGDDDFIRVWQPVPEMSRQRTFASAGVDAVVLSPDRNSFVTLAAQECKFWDETGKLHGDVGRVTGGITGAVYSHDGKKVALLGKDGVGIWDPITGQSLIPLVPYPNLGTATLSPASKYLVTANHEGKFQRWDSGTGQTIGEPGQHPQGITALVFRPDGKVFLTAGPDGKVSIWDTFGGPQIGNTLEHTGSVSAAAFRPSGTMVATGTEDGTVQIWDPATGVALWQAAHLGGPVRSLAFRPDGQVLLAVIGAAGERPTEARLWDANTGTPIGQPIRHPGGVLGATFSSDNQTVLSWGGTTARIWSAGNGRSIGPFVNHSNQVLAGAFEVNSQSFLTWNKGGVIRRWAVAAPVAGSAQQIALGTQITTGKELDKDGNVREFSSSQWITLHKRLLESGGPSQ